jgi:hypothetical protein
VVRLEISRAEPGDRRLPHRRAEPRLIQGAFELTPRRKGNVVGPGRAPIGRDRRGEAVDQALGEGIEGE